MFQFTTNNNFILDFLSKYPENIRKTCVEAILIYGMQTIKKKFPYGLTANQLISIAGIADINESMQRISSSCNISVNHKSAEIQKLLSESSVKNDEKTERFREPQYEKWSRSESKNSSRAESDSKILFSSKLKEPEICPYETAKSFFKEQDEDLGSETQVMKIAEDFLKNNYAVYLTRTNNQRRDS
ncbi:hypothetical protein SteCoe_181 [Stentor coeruleus]|uniref:Uncharacterized protein n=1 Tax=Stentor coeruleus TaxID=5963 RepID=A0A1R2D4N0_9CILI|nr:hypothetical protein SteCoe_181 [Stentor coeruleus]